MRTTPGFSMAPHLHDFYHVNRIMEGSLTVTLESKDYFVSAGCIFVLPPNLPHALASHTGYTQIGVDIHAQNDPTGLVQEVEKLGHEFSMVRIPLSLQQAKDQLTSMQSLLSTPTITNRLRAANLAEKQILDLLDGVRKPQQDAFLQKFTEMVTIYDPWRLKLSDMCRYLSLSRTQLELQAHNRFGCGAVEYCARLRYARICELLQGNTTLEAIASETGFCDACHLSRFFAARAGQTPGQYRKSLGL